LLFACFSVDHEREYKNKRNRDSYAALSNDKKKELLAKGVNVNVIEGLV